MAFVEQDEKLLGGQSSQPMGGGSSSSPLTGGGSSDVGSGVSTAGVGAGGQGGWTNIQAYLKANEGNQTTANALSNQVGGAFGEEESKIQDQSAQTKQQAESQKIQSFSDDELSRNIYDPNAHNTMKEYFKKSYQGPESFNYSLGQKTQDYGSKLGNDQQFGSLLNDVYNNAAGGRISTGQLALQRQLDSNNPALQQARQGLNSRYSALSNLASQATEDTNEAIQEARGSYDAQNRARDYYTNSAATAKSEYDRYMDITDNTGWSAKYGNMVEPYAQQYNTIQDFLGQSDRLAIPDRPPNLGAGEPGAIEEVGGKGDSLGQTNQPGKKYVK